MNTQSRIGFAGTPEFARAVLAGVIAAGYHPCVVYSQPDRPSGRGRKLRPSPVKELALTENIAVQTPRSLRKQDAQRQLAQYNLDLLIVAAYGLILPQVVLDTPTHGCLNVHASLLPRWRGAAPIERAIMAGDTHSGIALMQMDAGLDTGPVHTTMQTSITDQTTGASLESTLAQLGVAALTQLLPTLETSQPTAQPEEGASYAHKLSAADSVIDWRRSAAQIHQQVRALCERQPARSALGDLKLQILAGTQIPHAAAEAPGTIVSLSKQGLLVATGSGRLNLTQVQLNRGKGKPMAAADLRNGYGEYFAAGTLFDAPDFPPARSGSQQS